VTTSISIQINGIETNVPAGTTLLAAAQGLGIEIPTLCHLQGTAPLVSCMLCVVQEAGSGRLVPACATRVAAGLAVLTDTPAVQAARRDVLSLLLSEHVGDCEAPCRRICPAHLDIPEMLRQVGQGEWARAAQVARRDLVLPLTLGHVCPAPCEKGCRRGQLDQALAIRATHRQAGELALSEPLPPVAASGKRIAVLGAGPAGLAAAWICRRLGHACAVYETGVAAGGPLLALPETTLPRSVLEAEVAAIAAAGVVFHYGWNADVAAMRNTHDAVIVADAKIPLAPAPGILVAEESKLTVKAVGNGKQAAILADLLVRGIATPLPVFDSKIGKLRPSEVTQLQANCPEIASGASAAVVEAARCLHCDCRKPATCKLRQYATQYGALQGEFAADERRHLELVADGGTVVYEPGKCIRCGICVRITAAAGESLGLAFVGRGIATQVKVPFAGSLSAGLGKTATACVEACPTGALAFGAGKRV
jgi:ferredoxin